MQKKDVYNLTNPQKSIWYMEQYYKGSTLNNIAGHLFINEPVNFELLKKAANHFVKDNDGFRLKLFYDNENNIKQYISDFEPFDIELVDIKTHSDIYTLESRTCNTPFSLFDNNLYKFIAFRLPDGKGGLILVAHHIIYDAYTASLVTNKIVNIYSALLKGQASPELPTSYTEFINAEKDYINSNKYINDQKYWDDLFKTVPDAGTIPGTNQNIPDSCDASRKSFEFSKSQIYEIKKYCTKNKISNFNFFMGIFALYISRVSNLDNFVLGTPILNRSNFIQKNTPGMFISTVPFIVSIEKNQSVIDYFKKIGADSFTMFRHQKYPYSHILEKIRKDNPNQSNLYDIVISYQNAKTNKNHSDIPFEIKWSFNNNLSDSMQISLSDLNDAGILSIDYDYKVSKYKEEDIVSIHNRILYIIEQILKNDNISTDDIVITTPEEQSLILNTFNKTFTQYDKSKTIIDYFEKQVKSTPNNIALVCNNNSLTYNELNEKANQLSNYLIKNGIKNKDIVGIMVHRSFEMIIGIIAILKAGATYLPIDPAYPESRISYILENSDSKTLLVCHDTFNLINENYKKIDISLDSDIYTSKELQNLNIKIEPDDLIYMIYTSGSTGNPKGVMITHQNITNFVLAEKQYIDFSSSKTMVSVTTICFDIFALEVWCSLTSGMKLVIANDNEQMSPIALKDLCIKHHVNMIQTTPSRYQILLSYNDDLSFLNNFTDIMVGGEPFPKTLLEKLQNNTKANIYNMYGPTETTVWSTIKDLSKSKIISIGKPIANTTCYILDKNNHLLPPCVPGRLFIGGDGVTKGYWKRDDLTCKNFIESPFKYGETIYNTGDLAYYTKQGEIIHLGRTDFQVKIRGYRIELEEIENKVIKYHGITSCIVNAVEDSTKLCVYYISTHEIDITSLRAFLSKQLPNYMVPNYFVKLDKIPYTPNGKIDRKSLPLPEKNTKKSVLENRNEIDRFLINTLKKQLNINELSIADSVFDVGADSLTAIDLSTKISSKYNIDFSVKEIFENLTIKNISDSILSKVDTYIDNKITKTIKKQSYYVSSSQRRIYYAANIAGNNSVLYNMPGVIYFDKLPDIRKLNICFNKLIKRHLSLRTSFTIVGNEVYQQVTDDIYYNLQHTVEGNKTEQEIIHDFVEPFDLSVAPLFRAKIVSIKNKFLLLFDMHHIISDGFSISILVDELSKLYNGDELEPLQINYIDYAEWQFKQLAEGKLNTQKKYWVEQFSNGYPILNLPTDYARPAIMSYEGAKINKSIDCDLAEKLKNCAKKLNTSVYNFLLACYYILLAKYTSQEDIVIGTPAIGRNKEGLSNIIGMFVNSLPLKCHIDFSSTFEDLLKIIKRKTIDAIDNQDYPFDELVNDLNLQRDNSRNPLFDTMFIYQNNGLISPTLNGLNTKIYIPDMNISKFDLSLEVIPNDKEFKLNFEYSTKLFHKDTIKSLAGNFINIVSKIVNNSSIIISDIEILSAEDRNKILYEFNNTSKDYNFEKTIIDLFEEQVNQTPNNIALVFEDQQLTYRELNEKVNTLAWHLRNSGLNRNDIVSVMINRSLELLISILATLKCGSCYIPIDPNYPKDRVEYMLENSNSKLLLTDSYSSSIVKFSNTIIIDLENYNFKNNVQNLPHINKPDDTSFIIYTSGSTGKPKGVMLNHRAFTNLTYHLNDYVCFLKSDDPIAIGSVTTASFDIFTFETLIALQSGLKVVIANEDEQRLPAKFNSFIKNNNIKAIQMTPSRMKIFVDSISDCPNITNLDYVVLAGEPLPNTLLKELLKLGIKKVYNGYGPSETTVFSTFTDVTNYDVVNIGKPISNTQLYILDKNLLPVPIGVPGELYISGVGVCKGYLNNENLTKERFIKNPFIPKSIMYKTGDICKYLSNGEISYLERLDNQVKIRGLRIELEEIESKMLEISEIKKVKVVKQTNQNRDYISAYYVTKSSIKLEKIRKYLSMTLPNYMVPSYFTELQDFPYTPNGKIDKNSLPLPDLAANENYIEYVAPKTETEIKLIKILEKIFKTSNISILDNIFNLGGDSLIIIVLCTNIRQTFDVDLSFKDVINNPVIRDLANIIFLAKPTKNKLSIPKAQAMEYYPTSSSQKRIYFANQMQENSTLYNISGGMLLESLPNIEKLQNAFNTIVERHEILRTHFEIKDGNIVQKIEDNLQININVEKVNTNNIDELFTNYKTKFNLNKAPLFNIFLFELPSNKALIMLDIHHIIFDGSSLNNLLQEISIAYRDEALEELQISYKDFATWEMKQLENNGFEESQKFWTTIFEGKIPKLELPTIYKRPKLKTYKGTTYTTYLSEDITKSINKLSNKYNITPFMLMLCAYFILLYKYTNQEDIVVGTPVSGRLYKELEPLLGVFINTLPLRSRFNSNNTFEELLENVKLTCTNAFSHQDYPYDELVSSLNISRDTSRNPLFDTMFIFQNNGFKNIDFDGIKATVCSPSSNTSKFDITLEVLPEEQELKLSFEYCTELFDESFIRKFAENYKNIFNIIFLKPNIKISDISILDLDSKTEKNIPLSNSEAINLTSKRSKYIAPSNKLESQIVESFEYILDLANIGINDNFFELGGDSLLAIKLQIELLRKNIDITYPDIFMNPTAKDLAKKITSNELNTFNEINIQDFKDFNVIFENTCNLPKRIDKKPIGNILLAGATGFLGSHVLDQFLENENGIIYCLIRSKPGESIQSKLLNKLHFYFGNKYDYYIGSRIIPINSEITKNNLGLSIEDTQMLASDITCVINCAAKVEHYGNYNVYKEINVDATENLLKFALKYDKRFYQISTLSVSGINLEQQSYITQSFNQDVIFKENNLYIGQSLDNVYVRSKFEAEKLVLQYILKGLDAYILRVGNLMNRYEDGKFQQNAEQNAFVDRLITFAKLGFIPNSLLNNYLEFTPIDSCASAIIKLIQGSNKENRIFHLYDHNHVYVYEFVNVIRQFMDLEVITNKEFINRINKLLDKPDSDKILSGILRDFDANKNLIYDSKIEVKSFFTINYLMKLGFMWPNINNNYLTQFINYFIDLGFLKRKGNN